MKILSFIGNLIIGISSLVINIWFLFWLTIAALPVLICACFCEVFRQLGLEHAMLKMIADYCISPTYKTLRYMNRDFR